MTALASTYVDSFNRTAISGCWTKNGPLWLASTPTGLQINVTGGGSNASLITGDVYDLRGDTITLDLGTQPSGAGGVTFFRAFRVASGTFAATGEYARVRLLNGGGPVPEELHLEGRIGSTNYNQGHFSPPFPTHWQIAATSGGSIAITAGAFTFTLPATLDVSLVRVELGVQSADTSGGPFSVLIAGYNGGGDPVCPSFPDPPPAFYVPADVAAGAIHAQRYLWRDAKGQTAPTVVYLAGTHLQAAAAAAALRPLMESCSDAAVVGAEGPYYVDRFAFGSAAHGVEVGDQLVVTGITHRTGRPVTLTVPAALPTLFDARGLADPGAGPVGALADYWQRHAVTADGEAFYAHAARRQRQGQRRRYSTITRRPALGGQGL